MNRPDDPLPPGATLSESDFDCFPPIPPLTSILTDPSVGTPKEWVANRIDPPAPPPSGVTSLVRLGGHSSAGICTVDGE